MVADLLLALDQGTTSTRAIVFDRYGAVKASAQRELPQIYPRPGWVEHDPEEIWRATLDVVGQVAVTVGPEHIAALGLTNQRETTVVWDRASGAPVYNAVVWQDRRGADRCERMRTDGSEVLLNERTGLLADSYFSATKLAWILDNVEGARTQAERGELAFGTIDAFLVWRLTGGRVHATDATNASRTLLFDIHRQCWDDDLCRLFQVPRAVLPDVRDSVADFGLTDSALFGHTWPIVGIAGDQQAALVGQGCVNAGMAKATFGTGCFVLAHTGESALVSRHRLLTTPAYRLNGRSAYALEGSVFNAGTAVQWLRDKLGILRSGAEAQSLATSIEHSGGVYFVPAFTGLGAPHWDAEARGLLVGLNRDSGRAEIARAALEAVAYQLRDLFDAMAADGLPRPSALRVDGGMAVNDWLMQFVADLLNVVVERPRNVETTAWGAALLAGVGCGLYGSLGEAASTWRLGRRFTPAMAATDCERLMAGWRDALARTRSNLTTR